MVSNEFKKCDYIECVPKCEMLVKAGESQVFVLDTADCAYKQVCEEVVPTQKILVDECLKDGIK